MLCRLTAPALARPPVDLTCLHATHPGGRVHLDAEAGVQLVGLLLQLLYRGGVAFRFLRETRRIINIVMYVFYVCMVRERRAAPAR